MNKVKGGEHTVSKKKGTTTITVDETLDVYDPKTGQERTKVVKVDRVIDSAGVSHWYMHESAWVKALKTVALAAVGYATGSALLALGGAVAGYYLPTKTSLADYKNKVNKVNWQT